MKHPALPLLAAYALGAWFADVLGLSALYLLPLLVASIAAACWKRHYAVAFALLLTTLGGAHLLLRTLPLSQTDLRHLVGTEPVLARVRGHLLETPRQSSHLRNQEISVRYLAEFAVTELRIDRGKWRVASGTIMVSSREFPGDFYPPQTLELDGVLAPPPRPLAEGLFDYAAYLSRKGIHFRLKTDTAADWTVIGRQLPPRLTDRFLAWAKATLARDLPEDDIVTKLLWSMTLGIQDELPSERYQPFLLAGTLHVFAISGLHIALFGGVILNVLQLVRLPRAWAASVMFLLLWGYTAATGWQPSAVRATVMMSIVAGGWILRRPGNLPNSLLAAALIILLFDPRQMFGASFQLSFFVVLAIALILPKWESARDPGVDKILRIDPYLPEVLIPAWKQPLRGSFRWVYSFAGVSVAAWIGSLPLIAYYFHLVSLVSLGANLVVVPLSSLALAANVASISLPFLSPILNNAAWGLMHSMHWLSEFAASVPFGIFNVPSIPAIQIAFCYALLGFLQWKPSARFRHAPLLVLSAGIVTGGYHCYDSLQSTIITALPLNGGMSIHVDAPGKSRDLLVDAGHQDSIATLTAFLKAKGVNSLPPLVLTHGDIRHVGGAPLLVNTFRASQVLASPLRFRSTAYRKVIAGFETTPGLLSQSQRGRLVHGWRVLHPALEDKYSKADDGALVLLGDIHGTRVLLLSDLGADGQEALLERHAADLHADVLIAGLASDGSALGNSLLDAVHPGLLVVCDSEFPAQEKAKPALRDRLQEKGIRTWFTSERGAVTFEIRPGVWNARAADGAMFPSQPIARQ